MNTYSFQHIFNYCPKCGSGQFEWNNEKSKRCPTCGFVYYFNASAAVAAFITNEHDELLVCRRRKDPAKGTLDLPGGFVDDRETAEQAVVREIKEELNLDVISMRYLFSLPNTYQYSGLDIPTLDLFFALTVADFTLLRADDDVEDVQFIPRNELRTADFGLASIQKAIEQFILSPPGNTPHGYKS